MPSITLAMLNGKYLYKKGSDPKGILNISSAFLFINIFFSYSIVGKVPVSETKFGFLNSSLSIKLIAETTDCGRLFLQQL